MRIKDWAKWSLLFAASGMAALQLSSCVARWLVDTAILNMVN